MCGSMIKLVSKQESVCIGYQWLLKERLVRPARIIRFLKPCLIGESLACRGLAEDNKVIGSHGEDGTSWYDQASSSASTWDSELVSIQTFTFPFGTMGSSSPEHLQRCPVQDVGASGWSKHLEWMETEGFWTQQQRGWHINILELIVAEGLSITDQASREHAVLFCNERFYSSSIPEEAGGNPFLVPLKME